MIISIFDALTPDQKQKLFGFAKVVQLKKDAVFIREGSQEKTFYCIQSGKVKVYKKTGQNEHLLAYLGPGETVGELALIDDEPRSTSVQCVENSVVYQFDITELSQNPELADIWQLIGGKMGQKLSQRLRSTNEVAVLALKNKLAMSIFSIRMLILLSLYALFLTVIERTKHYLPNTTLPSLFLIIIFSAVALSVIRQSDYPIQFYGLSLNRFFQNGIEAVAYSIPIMLLIVLIKWLAITYISGLNHYPLFDPSAIFNEGVRFDWTIYLVSMLMYLAFCPLQEFIVRGCVQTSLQNLLEGSPNLIAWKAIIISNVIFASAHSHTSLGFALTVFVPGIFWGWLFYRQKTLVGVSLSHSLIGVWAVFLVGFENII